MAAATVTTNKINFKILNHSLVIPKLSSNEIIIIVRLRILPFYIIHRATGRRQFSEPVHLHKFYNSISMQIQKNFFQTFFQLVHQNHVLNRFTIEKFIQVEEPIIFFFLIIQQLISIFLLDNSCAELKCIFLL